MTSKNFPSSIQNLKSNISLAKAATRDLGANQLQIQFLSRVERIHKSLHSITAMINAVETALAPQQKWRTSLNLTSIQDIVSDFSTKLDNDSFDIVGKYDNIDLLLAPVVQNIKNECSKIWVVFRDQMFSAVNLDFEAPNLQILRAINPSVKLPVNFAILQRRLRMQKNDEFAGIWDDCDNDPSKLSDYVDNLRESIQQYLDAVKPVLDTMSTADPKVAEFLNDAARGEATLRQFNSQEIQEWLALDPNLLDSFLLKFKEEN